MQFSTSQFSLLALLALVPLVPAVFRFRKDPTARIRLTLISLICLALFIALSGLLQFPSFKGNCLIFLVDRSGSSLIFQERAREQFQKLKKEAIENDTGGDLGILAFFGDGYSYSGRTAPLDDVTWPGGDFDFPGILATNVQKALDSSLLQVPEGYKPKIIILGDGLCSASSVSAPSNIETDYVDVSFPVTDAALTDFQCPAEIGANEPVTCRITAYSSSRASGIIRLHESVSGKILNTVPVQFNRGQNTYDLGTAFKESGYKSLLAEVEIEMDAYPENNTLRKFLQVSTNEEPHYLVIGKAIEGLRGSLTVSPEKLRGFTLEQLVPFSAIIINDVSYTRLGDKGALLLSSYVLEAGGGLVAAGTSKMFGPGDYKGTDLESVFPLSSDPRSPDTSKRRVMIAVDTSGSMDEPIAGGRGKKINGAKAAALGFILDRENEKETRIGLLFFSAEISVVKLPEDRAGEDVLKEKLKTVIPHGGTKILPALGRCVELLSPDAGKEEDLYLFLITDGITREDISAEAVSALVNDISSRNIGLLTLNIGEEEETELREITKRAAGRFVQMGDGEDMAVSFRREADREISDLFHTELSILSMGAGAAIVRIPEVSKLSCTRYIRTSLQKGALCVLRNPDTEDPVAAIRFSGAGRTAALVGAFSKKNETVLSALISWAGRDRGQSGRSVEFVRTGRVLKTTYMSSLPIPPGSTVSCRIAGTNGGFFDYRLERSSRTEFSAESRLDTLSDVFEYAVSINDTVIASGKISGGYPAEYNPLAGNRFSLIKGSGQKLSKSVSRSYVPFVIIFLALFLTYEIYSVIILRKK